MKKKDKGDKEKGDNKDKGDKDKGDKGEKKDKGDKDYVGKDIVEKIQNEEGKVWDGGSVKQGKLLGR